MPGNKYHQKFTIRNWKKYGVISHDFNKLYHHHMSINNCQLCNILFDDTIKNQRCLDHDHKTGSYRLTLCRSCNAHFKKAPQNLKCNNKSGCSNNKIYQKMSEFIIIQLKRYNRNNNKNNKFIKYDEYLNMDPYVINKTKSTIYKLMGIIVHAGGLNFGHYYSICYNMVDEKWRIYNDENVGDIETKNIFNKNPYCLFYKRINE